MGEAVFYAAHDLFPGGHAVYEPIISGRMHFVLVFGKLGIPVDRWFAFKVGVHGLLEDRYHYLNAHLVARMGRWFGGGIADPEYLNNGDVGPILEWISKSQSGGKNCCVKTVVSNAVRIARAASSLGLSLEGARFIVSGEPVTEAKQQLIAKTGARIAPRYGPGGGNGALFGCGHPAVIDEMHVPEHIFTLVEHPRPLDYGGPPIYPLMLTTLHASAPRFLLNVQNGDYATMTRRDCGCALEKIGFTRRLHTIRSFEKFTSEGMNYFTADLFELLENIIPSEFGGGPGDYQLVEEEDSAGQTRLTLLVHPNVGDLDSEKVLFSLQQALAEGSRNNRFMTGIWRNAGTFRIRREPPNASARGKILPLQIRR
jgi:hypothetical protein